MVPMSRWNTGNASPTLSDLSSRTITVIAGVLEEATGTVLSGNGTVRCTSSKYTLTFLSITPASFKPGLTFNGFVSYRLITIINKMYYKSVTNIISLFSKTSSRCPFILIVKSIYLTLQILVCNCKFAINSSAKCML